MCMYKIALVGDRDSIIGFQLLGISIFPVTNKEETINILNELIKEKYAAVFITEEIASQIFEKIEELQKISLISLTIIPNKLEKKDLGLKILRKNMEKAIGIDILFRKEGE
ncbi:MAG: V-type ATP synthase subunit F [Candidatus Atribacteria bacterium]